MEGQTYEYEKDKSEVCRMFRRLAACGSHSDGGPSAGPNEAFSLHGWGSATISGASLPRRGRTSLDGQRGPNHVKRRTDKDHDCKLPTSRSACGSIWTQFATGAVCVP